MARRIIPRIKMAESEDIRETVNQAAIWAATAVMMAFIDADVRSRLIPTASPRGPHKQRHERPALEKPSFNWSVQDRYAQLMNFKIEVTNILETKAY